LKISWLEIPKSRQRNHCFEAAIALHYFARKHPELFPRQYREGTRHLGEFHPSTGELWLKTRPLPRLLRDLGYRDPFGIYASWIKYRLVESNLFRQASRRKLGNGQRCTVAILPQPWMIK
jgi:hypothetical protein